MFYIQQWEEYHSIERGNTMDELDWRVCFLFIMMFMIPYIVGKVVIGEFQRYIGIILGKDDDGQESLCFPRADDRWKSSPRIGGYAEGTVLDSLQFLDDWVIDFQAFIENQMGAACMKRVRIRALYVISIVSQCQNSDAYFSETSILL